MYPAFLCRVLAKPRRRQIRQAEQRGPRDQRGDQRGERVVDALA